MLRVATNVTTGNIMAYRLAAAATATGLNKTMILRAIKTGKIFGARDKSGEWCVEAAELHRVYPSLQRQRAPRMRRSVATIDTEMRTRPSSAELRIWELRKKWQQPTGRLAADLAADHRVKPWWRRLVDHFLDFRRPKPLP
jgi:hypothetical protein